MSRNHDGTRRHTPAWAAARAARKTRRAADPHVQARAQQHAAKAAQQDKSAAA